jgi:hypothetical protein
MKTNTRWASGIALVWILALPAFSGTMGLRWDPVPGAKGYRVYHGTSSGEYEAFTDVGKQTQVNLTVEDCVPHYVAVKAYNNAGESPEFSNEIAGMARPQLEAGQRPLLVQGGSFVLSLEGANFRPGAALEFAATDAQGNSLIRVDSISVADCHNLQALITVEPTSPGFRAMEIGDHTFKIRNPDGAVGTVPFEVALDPERLDINDSDLVTEDKIDGRDLAWLGYAYASEEGQVRWNPDADLDGDGVVDGEDLAMLAPMFGSCWDGGSWTASCP